MSTTSEAVGKRCGCRPGSSVAWLFAAMVLVSDQVTKHLALAHLKESPIEVIPGLFNLTLVMNRGAAFGIFSSWPDPSRRIVLALVSIAALLVIVRFVIHEAKEDGVSRIVLAGIFAGALGNIIDRVRFDAVVDFLDFYWKEYHWPAFNIADSAISVGVIVLIIRLTFCSSGHCAARPNESQPRQPAA